MDPIEKLEQVQNELLCSICCDYFIRAITMSCSHSFCYNCISEWKKNNHNCPICRQPIYSMAPSRALDNMVAALNVNSNRVTLNFTENLTDVVETPTFEHMHPSTSSDTIFFNDDDYDFESAETESNSYISDDNSNLSFNFNGNDSQEESPDILDLNDMDDLNVSRDSSMFVDDTPDLNDVIDYEGSDNESIYSNFSLPSSVGNVTIKHTIEFSNN